MRITATVDVSCRYDMLKGMSLGRPEALATALDDLLDTPGERQRLGETGCTCARQSEPMMIAPRIIKAFGDVLRRRTGLHYDAN